MKTVPIVPCKQILPVLDFQEQIECLRGRQRGEGEGGRGEEERREVERSSAFGLVEKRTTHESGINIWFSV